MAKGLYGLHHGAVVAVPVAILHFIDPTAAKIHAIGMIYWFISREWDQYEHRKNSNMQRVIQNTWHKLIEWWDWITPTVMSLSYILYASGVFNV